MRLDRLAARWWLTRVWIPIAAFGACAIALGSLELDRASLEPFFDRAQGVFPLRRSWFFDGVLHQGGRATVLLAALGLLLTGVWRYRHAATRAAAGRCLYLATCVAASTGLCNLWKDLARQTTPWNTVQFGGSEPWFEPTTGAFFRTLGSPGAHSVGGFAWVALYFVGASLGARKRWLWLAPGLALGTLFALAQHVRGAHPPSHELWSIALAWGIAAAGASLARRLRVLEWREDAAATDVASATRADAALPWLIGSAALFAGMLFFAFDMLLEHLAAETSEWSTRFEIAEVTVTGLGVGAAAFLLTARIVEARERAAARLRDEREERFRALGRMAASVAHEVRNPLHTLRLIVDEQRRQLPALSSHALQPELDACIERIDHAVDLIHGFARGGRDEHESSDLAQALREAASAAERMLPAHASLRTDVAAAPALVRGTVASLRIVLDNLLRNAIEAAPAGSAVEVQLARQHGEWNVVIRNQRADGAPLAPGESGTSTKPEGLGLGLSISRRLAARLGGAIDLEFEGRRVTCTLRLPALDAEERE
ncbi:MAG: hypothetical protein EPO68_05355 [Planctomycetota bacterium]|nr:MAG: hypothetical protein EPO68_05355 [Planctomycetota bacterium]